MLDEPTRLLVVDDDPILREFAQVHLATPVASVDTAADGEDGWARLIGEPFDLALIDIDMPKLNGFGLVERVRAEAALSCLPIVMLTGREDMASIDRAYEIGATSFVTKPVNWRQLSHQLRYVLRTSRIEARLRDAVEGAERASAVRSQALSAMADELRTSLHRILSASDLLDRDMQGPLSTEHQGCAALVSSSGQRLLNMLDSMMADAELISGACQKAEDGERAAGDKAVAVDLPIG